MGIQSVCIYCGSRSGGEVIFQQTAIKLGEALAKAKITLIYGGGDNGLMGSTANAANINGGKVISIIPEFLINREASIESLSEQQNVFITKTMHQRKQLMFEKAEAFIALPGGMGTLEELTEMITWAQLGTHKKPIILANINNFWQPLLELFSHMENNNFVCDFKNYAPIIANNVEDIMLNLK